MWPFVREEIQKRLLTPPEYAKLRQEHAEPCFLHEIVYTSLELPKRIELPDAIDSNVYHLFFYMIARFYFFDNSGTIVYYYPKKTNNYLCEQALSHLPSRFQRETEKQPGFEYIDMPACGWRLHDIEDKWIYAYVRDLYKPLWESIPQQKGKYTFLSRNKYNSPSRRCLNEEELYLPLKQLGFSIYCMENLTFEEQIRLFRSSEFIVGVHGAALAWCIFCHPGTLFCEINRANKTCPYEDACRQIGLRYCKFVGVDEPTKDKYPDMNNFRPVEGPFREKHPQICNDDLLIQKEACIQALHHLIQTELV